MATKAKAGTAVAKVDSKKTAVAEKVDASMLLSDAQQDRGVKRDDLAIEFLRVLQALSPQVIKGNEKFIKGATVGQFITTVTNNLYDGDEGVDLVPIFHTQSYIQWRIREKGGGMILDHGANKPTHLKTTRDEKKRERVLNADGSMSDDQIVFSHMFFVFLYDRATGEYAPVAFNLAGKQLKKARAWVTFMETVKADSPRGDGSKFNPAWYFYTYRVTTVPERNEQGSWMGVNIATQLGEGIEETLKLPFGSGVYMAAREYVKLVAGGKVKTQKPDEEIVDAEVTPAGEGDDEGF